MFKPEEYQYYTQVFSEMLNDFEMKPYLKHDDKNRRIERTYWNKEGSSVPIGVSVNVTLYHVPNEKKDYRFDIFPDHVNIGYWGNNKSLSRKFPKDFSTEAFFDNSDAAFFQASTMEDFSEMEESLFRLLVALSLKVRENANKES